MDSEHMEGSEHFIKDSPEAAETAPDGGADDSAQAAGIETCGAETGKHKKKEKKRDKHQHEIDELKRERDENLDRYLRTLAEFDNFRKRTIREKAAMFDDGIRDTVLRLLPVLDSFERAAASVPEGDAVSKGFVLILRQFQDVLKALGVEEIAALGQPFDPGLHDAVMHVEDESFGENTVAEVLLKGYRHKDRTIRHSMVKVAN